METIKIHCPCGQNYSFEVEPLRGQMPGAVSCPACGADGTDAANAVLTQRRAAQPQAPRSSVIPPPIISEVAPAPQLTRQAIHSGTVASNVARLEPDWKLVARTRPFMWMAVLGLVIGGILGGWLAHPVLYFILPASAAWMLFGLYRELTAKLMSGDVCPAVVISEQPWRVAVFTDLSATGGSSPAIRIVDQPLGKMAGGSPAVGTRLATVAHYLPPLKEGNWRSFVLEVINCICSDLNGIRRVEESISQHEWQLLDRHLEQLPSREPGLYRFSGGTVRVYDRAHRVRDPILAILILAAIVVPIVWAAIDKARGDRPPRPAAGMPPRPEWVAPVPNRPTQPGRPEFQPRTSTYPRPTIPEGVQLSPESGISPPLESDFKVGDRVEVQVRREWQPATVIEVRNLSLRVRLEADDSLPERWVSARRTRRPAE